MQYSTLSPQIHTPLPWHLTGDGYILNYWLSPQLTHHLKRFNLEESKFGRLIQIVLVRYHTSPVGPYDELLLLDHKMNHFKMHSNIPKIYVSTQASIDEGRFHWGIPKELAQFNWEFTKTCLLCEISTQGEKLRIHLNLSNPSFSFPVSSNILPSQLLRIQQQDQQYQYNFSPSFKGHLTYISQAQWHSSQNIFPDLSQALFLKGFYSKNFELIFPEAIKKILVQK